MIVHDCIVCSKNLRIIDLNCDISDFFCIIIYFWMLMLLPDLCLSCILVVYYRECVVVGPVWWQHEYLLYTIREFWAVQSIFPGLHSILHLHHHLPGMYVTWPSAMWPSVMWPSVINPKFKNTNNYKLSMYLVQRFKTKCRH